MTVVIERTEIWWKWHEFQPKFNHHVFPHQETVKAISAQQTDMIAGVKKDMEKLERQRQNYVDDFQQVSSMH